MEPTERFSDRVGNYLRYRPGYPPGVLDLMQERYGLTRSAEVADVGSGTGALARLFLENGNRVFGVEPNYEMRRAGERELAQFAGFTSVSGTAERTTLENRSVDLVTAGQAFHWFRPGATRLEFGRVLRPGGRVLVVWNERRLEGTAFSEAYERLLRTHGTDYAEVNHGKRAGPEQVRAFFSPVPVESWTFENEQILDLEGMKGRLLSSSYVPAEDEPRCAEMLLEAEDVFESHAQDGTVTMRYDSRVYVGRL